MTDTWKRHGSIICSHRARQYRPAHEFPVARHDTPGMRSCLVPLGSVSLFQDMRDRTPSRRWIPFFRHSRPDHEAHCRKGEARRDQRELLHRSDTAQCVSFVSVRPCCGDLLLCFHPVSLYFPRYKMVFYLVASYFGIERVDDLSHFPSDVIAGAIFGTAVAFGLLSRKPGLLTSHRLPLTFLYPQCGGSVRHKQ